MGFGQEMKDFLDAAQAGVKIVGSGDDLEYKKLRNRVLKQKSDQLADPAYQKLTKDRLQAQIDRLRRGPKPVDPSISEGRRLNNRLRALQIKELETPTVAPSAADEVSPYGAPPSLGPQSAIPMGGEQMTSFSARGGVMARPGYADGGVVEEEDPLPAEPAPDMSADQLDNMDAEDAAYDSAPDDEGAAAPNGGYSRAAAHDAVKAGLSYAGSQLLGEGKGAVTVDMSARSAGAKKYLSGAGAASHAEMTAVAKAIDPEGKMSESERNMASLSTVYEYYLRKNDPQAADRSAASLLQYFRQASDRYKALSAAAAERGDLDGAMKMALRAHANIPDGLDMALEKTKDGHIKYSLTNPETGKVIEHMLATPEQMLAYATKGAMHTFDDLLLRSASGRAELATRAKGKPKSPKAYTPAERDTADASVDTSIANIGEESQLALKDQLPEVKGQAYQMQAANPGLNKGDVLQAVVAMTQVDPDNPSTRTFKTIGPVDGGVKFQLSNGQDIFVPDSMVPRIKALRDKNAALAKKAQAKAKGSAERMGGTVDALKNMFAPGHPKPYKSALDEIADRADARRARGAIPTAPQPPAPTTEERINMARRAQGLPPLPAGINLQGR